MELPLASLPKIPEQELPKLPNVSHEENISILEEPEKTETVFDSSNESSLVLKSTTNNDTQVNPNSSQNKFNAPETLATLVLKTKIAPIDSSNALEVAPSTTTPNNVIYVNQNATGNNNGSSWGNAYTDLQDALAVAQTGEQIWVAAGTYTPGNERDDTFIVPDGVKLYGGFSGDESSFDERDREANQTILSGENISYTVLNLSNTDAETVVDSFTITGGNADGKSFESNERQYGGGIYAFGTDAQLANLSIEDNFANLGGGLYLREGQATLTNVKVEWQ